MPRIVVAFGWLKSETVARLEVMNGIAVIAGSKIPSH